MSDSTSAGEKFKCPYCGESNSLESEFCRACYNKLHIPEEVRARQKLAGDLEKLAGGGVCSGSPEAPMENAGAESPGRVWSELLESFGRLMLVAALFIFYLRWLRIDNYFSWLDYINLAFHEAGHLFLGFFGRFIMMLGGTLFQLLMPAVCAVHLWRRGSRLGWQLCVFWLGESLLNISIYAGDAIAQALPLVGGGEHDWTYLLTETGLIAHTPAVSKVIFLAGSAVSFFALYLIGSDGLSLLPLKTKE